MRGNILNDVVLLHTGLPNEYIRKPDKQPNVLNYRGKPLSKHYTVMKTLPTIGMQGILLRNSTPK